MNNTNVHYEAARNKAYIELVGATKSAAFYGVTPSWSGRSYSIGWACGFFAGVGGGFFGYMLGAWL